MLGPPPPLGSGSGNYATAAATRAPTPSCAPASASASERAAAEAACSSSFRASLRPARMVSSSSIAASTPDLWDSDSTCAKSTCTAIRRGDRGSAARRSPGQHAGLGTIGGAPREFAARHAPPAPPGCAPGGGRPACGSHASHLLVIQLLAGIGLGLNLLDAPQALAQVPEALGQQGGHRALQHLDCCRRSPAVGLLGSHAGRYHATVCETVSEEVHCIKNMAGKATALPFSVPAVPLETIRSFLISSAHAGTLPSLPRRWHHLLSRPSRSSTPTRPTSTCQLQQQHAATCAAQDLARSPRGESITSCWELQRALRAAQRGARMV